MDRENSINIVNSFYSLFNDLKLDELSNLISPNIKLSMNMHDPSYGKEEFMTYMNDSTHYFDEKVSEIVIMASEDGRYISSKFVFSGTYISTDPFLGVKASGQSYSFEAHNYFTIDDNGLITEAACFYNENALVKYLSGVDNHAEL